jgi:hypothetical protein
MFGMKRIDWATPVLARLLSPHSTFSRLPVNSFDSLDLIEPLQRALAAEGYENPPQFKHQQFLPYWRGAMCSDVRRQVPVKRQHFSCPSFNF